MERPTLTKKDEQQFRDEIAINPDNIRGDMLRHATLFAHYGLEAVKAEYHYDELKIELEQLEATLDHEIREKHATEGKKPTEAMITNEIRMDPKWSDLQHQAIKAKLIMAAYKTSKEAFAKRGEMLLHLSLNG